MGRTATANPQGSTNGTNPHSFAHHRSLPPRNRLGTVLLGSLCDSTGYESSPVFPALDFCLLDAVRAVMQAPDVAGEISLLQCHAMSADRCPYEGGRKR